VERVLTSRMKGASALGGEGGREMRRCRFVNKVFGLLFFAGRLLAARRALGFGDGGFNCRGWLVSDCVLGVELRLSVSRALSVSS